MGVLRDATAYVLARGFSFVVETPLQRVPGVIRAYTYLYEAFDVEVRFRFDGVVMAPVVMDDGWLLYYSTENEAAVRRTFSARCKPGMTVVDVGASIGSYTLVAANRVGSTGSVIAFEPSPSRFDGLERNVALNGFQNVEARRLAIADEVDTQELAVDTTGTYAADGLVAETTTLDTALDASPDVVKIDVEGGEFDVLEGMERTLIEARPAVILEVHPMYLESFDRRAKRWMEWLFTHDYGVYEIRADGLLVAVTSFGDERAHYLLDPGGAP
jgi:FkbM family methyltransferase